MLAGLDETDRHFADEVRKAIFTFTNIPERVDTRDVAKVIRAADQGQLVTALAAAMAGPEAQNRAADFILANMSQRMAAQLKEEIEALGKVKAKDGEEAMTAIVQAIRELETQGEILLIAGED